MSLLQEPLTSLRLDDQAAFRAVPWAGSSVMVCGVAGVGGWVVVDAAVHLPLVDFGEGFSYRRLAGIVDAARECGFAAISANDHFVFSAPWLDGPTALAAVAGRSGGMKLVTTLALASLRGPVPLAKALSALDILSGGRVIAGVGPGPSRADYEAAGVPCVPFCRIRASCSGRRLALAWWL